MMSSRVETTFLHIIQIHGCHGSSSRDVKTHLDLQLSQAREAVVKLAPYAQSKDVESDSRLSIDCGSSR